jgi:hypothetical protein
LTIFRTEVRREKAAASTPITGTACAAPAASAAPMPTAAWAAAAATAKSCAPSAIIAEISDWAYLIIRAIWKPWNSALRPRSPERALLVEPHALEHA